jgi:hypothetical protein
MKTWKRTAAVATGLVLSIWMLAANAEAAVTNDLGVEWSETANPNGVWSCNEGTNVLPHVAWWDHLQGGWTCPQPAWATCEDCNSRVPAWFRSVGCEAPGYDFQAGDIIVHSGDSTSGVGKGPANVTWTSTFHGAVTITGAVWLGRDLGQGRANHWSLYHGTTLLTEGDVFDGDSYSRSTPFFFSAGSGGSNAVRNLAVAPGDCVKLELVKTAASPYGEFTGVKLAVVSVPAPAFGPPWGLTSAGFVASVSLAPGESYRVQTTTNFVSWTDLTNFVAGATSLSFWDPYATNFAYRFYRVVSP